MIVVDASAMVEALVGRAPDDQLLDLLAGDLHAPYLLDVEVLSALRGLELANKIPAAVAAVAKATFFEFAITRYETQPLAERIWQLRHQFTAYDASYIALAEGLDASLLTCDKKLAGRGHTATVVVC